MATINQPSNLEKSAGNLGTESALTLIGALSGNPVAALLPVLSGTLASSRHKKRVEKAIAEIDATLREHHELLMNLSDCQYKVLNEAILAVLQTTSQEKIEYLRRAIRNSLQIEDLKPQESVAIGRILRDISAEEADFLVNSFQYERIEVSASPSEHEMKVLTVEPESSEGTVVTGLISLGLLTAGEATWAETGLLRFSPLVAKLLVVLRA